MFAFDLVSGKVVQLPIGAVFDYWPR